MSMRLPPLNSLRAFEAAARRGGFAAAAGELNVTPAAVSHQVKSLEAHLETALFERRARGLILTDAGRQLLPQLTRGLELMARGVGSLCAAGLSGRLTVTAPPSFAALWLVPRLLAFQQAYPDVALRVLAPAAAPDLLRGEADVRIAYGLGDHPGLVTQLLMREEVFPVCAPALLNHTRLARVQDLARHTLLHDLNASTDERTMSWQRWLRDAGAGGVDPDAGIEFSDAVLLIEAAVRGQGVALGRTSLVREHLASGRLVRPLKDARPADHAYYTVTTPAANVQPRVLAFLEWLHDLVEREEPAGAAELRLSA